MFDESLCIRCLYSVYKHRILDTHTHIYYNLLLFIMLLLHEFVRNYI